MLLGVVAGMDLCSIMTDVHLSIRNFFLCDSAIALFYGLFYKACDKAYCGGLVCFPKT